MTTKTILVLERLAFATLLGYVIYNFIQEVYIYISEKYFTKKPPTTVLMGAPLPFTPVPDRVPVEGWSEVDGLIMKTKSEGSSGSDFPVGRVKRKKPTKKKKKVVRKKK